MIVDVITIKDASKSFEFEIEPTEIDLEIESAKVVETIEVNGEIKRGIVQTNVAGTISTTVEIECIRCLQPVKKALDIVFNVGFVTPEYYTQEKEAEINQDDLQISVFEGDKIDLSEIAREQILLNLPEQVFCQEDCQGLCQKCGANRNLINCNCEEKELDPRWAALKNLK